MGSGSLYGGCSAGRPDQLAYVLGGETYYAEDQVYSIPMRPHTWGAWQTIYPADSEGNIMQRTCTVCGAVEKSSHEHTYTFSKTAEWDIRDGQVISVTVTATCEDDPDETVTLTYSGDQITAKETKAASCTKPGQTVYTVTASIGSNSETYTTTVETPAKGHTWYKTDAQWSDDHSQITVTFRCLRCKTETTTTANTKREELQKPDCETEGLTTYSAELDMGSTYCQFAETVTVPALGHDWGPDGKCTRCGAVKPGDVTVVPSAVTVPEADQQTLESVVLTPADRAQVVEGTPVIIGLDVTNADDTAPTADKQTVDNAIASSLPGYAVGQYLDLSLFKQVGDNAPIVITSTGEEQITLVITVPEALRAAGRTFAIVRVHDGAAAVLNDLDSDPATITFQTNLFSTYAIVYTDKPVPTDAPTATAAPTPTPTASASATTSPKTGDETALLPWLLLLLVCGAALAALAVTTRRRCKN